MPKKRYNAIHPTKKVRQIAVAKGKNSVKFSDGATTTKNKADAKVVGN